MRYIKGFFIILIMFTMVGCAAKNVYQVHGMPVPDDVIEARVLALGMTVTYHLSKSFSVKEDDEAYRSYEFLSLTEDEVHKIKEEERINMKVSIFNPQKYDYLIKQYAIVEGGEDIEVIVYEGNLSRNSIEFGLPNAEKKKVVFYYDVYDNKNNLVYQSFRAQYVNM